MPERDALDRFLDAFWEDQGAWEYPAEWEAEEERAASMTADGTEGADGTALPEPGGAQTGTVLEIPKGTSVKQRPVARTWAALILLLLALPAILYVATYVYHGRKFLLVSLIIVVLSMVPFFLVFEGRKPQAREIVILAVLSALAVAGRAAFFMVPQFKPMAAMVILSAAAFGGEAGFLVGSVSAMASNMFMGQGPWTPWQMFAFGVVGFLAGVLFRPGRLPAKTPALCIYGFFSVFLIYGFIMNTATMFMISSNGISLGVLLTLLISGVPMDLVHAGATVLFLLVLARPMLEKLDRVKRKYGLLAEKKND